MNILLNPAVTAVMFSLGLLLGFVGVGGAGFIAALLILVFHFPVHLSFGIALGAMFAGSALGGWSHLREGNVEPVIGTEIGLTGVLGAYLGSGLALATGAAELKTLAGLTLVANAGVVYLRTRVAMAEKGADKGGSSTRRWLRELPSSAGIGLGCGFGSGFLSIGTAPWIQVGLLFFKGTDLRRTIGTAMFSLSFMSLTGAIRFAQGGQVDLWLLASVVLGLSLGTFLGAKFTKQAPRRLVRSAMVLTPMTAGLLLLMAPV